MEKRSEKFPLNIKKDLQKFYILLDKMIELYNKLQHLFLINLNNVFKKKIYEELSKDKLINDTIEILEKNKYDLNKLLKTPILEKEDERNLYVSLTKELNILLNDSSIEKNKGVDSFQIPLNMGKSKKSIFKVKKEHEVEQLSNFIETISNEKIETLLEMGCGKSYLTETLLNHNKNCLYIGIDMKENLIKKTNSINNKDNFYVLYSIVTLNNFQKFYDEKIKEILISKKKKEKNIFLFGLHSCGNLTSDTLKVFIKYDCFSHLTIVSCCMNLLTEFITPQSKSLKLFQNYYDTVGFTAKGDFLEKTCVFNYNFNEIGYPLSKYIVNVYPYLFLTRTARNSAMQNNTETEDINSIMYKKFYFRTLLQAFFEEFIQELSFTYAFGKIDLKENESFKDYLLKFFHEFDKNQNNSVIQKKNELLKNLDSVLEKFINEQKGKEKILWSVNMIRMKFAKLIEYIIALDRILYLIENGIENVKLVKIFNENISTRNILIYASRK